MRPSDVQSASSFINPLHEDAVKWKISENIRTSIIAGTVSGQCNAIIIIPQNNTYAENYASDFVRILNVINWKYDRKFAVAPVDRGITVRAVTDQLQSRVCSNTLAAPLEHYARSKSGNSIGDIQRWVMTADAPDYLKQCPEGLCIEVNFGNEEER
jgi:hypothetical protein